ncbi:hypothetical protein BC828DRAFT_399913 [Blastocladiella britannica]|nr:hypothetical protein BC828DRAFT_399913 [Blastocladiella britannica]
MAPPPPRYRSSAHLARLGLTMLAMVPLLVMAQSSTTSSSTTSTATTTGNGGAAAAATTTPTTAASNNSTSSGQQRPSHCFPIDLALTPFCGPHLSSSLWTALPLPAAAAGAALTPLAKAYLTSLDTFALVAAANWTRALRNIECNAPDDRRYSLFRTCADCAASYARWVCRTAFAECASVPSPAFVFNATNPDPHLAALVNRSVDGAGSFRASALTFLLPSTNTSLSAADVGADKPLPPLLASMATGANPAALGIDATNNATQPLTAPASASPAAIASASAVLAAALALGTDRALLTAVPPYPSLPLCLNNCQHVVQSCPTSFGFLCPKVRPPRLFDRAHALLGDGAVGSVTNAAGALIEYMACGEAVEAASD